MGGRGPSSRREAADGHHARRPPGLGQDDHRRQARQAAGRRAAARCWSPPTSSAPPPSSSSSSSGASSRCRSTARRADRCWPVTRPDRRRAQRRASDVVILDTAGRLHVDERADGRSSTQCATRPSRRSPLRARRDDRPGRGQAPRRSTTVASTASILTKLDGDARGGAALSIKRSPASRSSSSASARSSTSSNFHPERMASRILGMGDVLTLIEKAEAGIEEDEQARLEKQLLAGSSPSTTSSRATGCSAGWARSRACSRCSRASAAAPGRRRRRERHRPGRGDRQLDDAARSAACRT